jgi:hypothetical protein
VIGLRPVCFPGSAWRYSSNALLGYTEMVARLEAEERRLERAVQVAFQPRFCQHWSTSNQELRRKRKRWAFLFLPGRTKHPCKVNRTA